MKNLKIKRYDKKDKDEKLLQQLKQSPSYICTICYRSLYQRRIRLFVYVKCHILTAELYHSMKSFDVKLHICEECHKHHYKFKFHFKQLAIKWPFQDPIPDELKDIF